RLCARRGPRPTLQSASLDPAAHDSILQEVLGALERSEELDLAELQRRHAGHEQVVQRMVDAAASYRSLASSLFRSSREAHALVPGERLGDFEIESLLSQGGMAV